MAKKFDYSKLVIPVLLIMVTAIFTLGGKLMYNIIWDLVEEQKAVKTELMHISNYIAKSDIKTEYIEKQLEEIKEKLNE